MNRVLLILGILLCTLGDGIAQNIQRVTGVVSDKAGITLPGVNIVNLRSKDGTITDANGFLFDNGTIWRYAPLLLYRDGDY